MFPQFKKKTAAANLRILSLGRNNIKRLEKLDDIAGSLEEVLTWLFKSLFLSMRLDFLFSRV